MLSAEPHRAAPRTDFGPWNVDGISGSQRDGLSSFCQPPLLPHPLPTGMWAAGTLSLHDGDIPPFLRTHLLNRLPFSTRGTAGGRNPEKSLVCVLPHSSAGLLTMAFASVLVGCVIYPRFLASRAYESPTNIYSAPFPCEAQIGCSFRQACTTLAFYRRAFRHMNACLWVF